eukprot:COSAG05_NODE_301_length_11860_cov_30.927812_10_plen_32_part_00
MITASEEDLLRLAEGGARILGDSPHGETPIT